MAHPHDLAPMPLIVFSDITDLDPQPAENILSDNGYTTMRLDLAHNKDVPLHARRACGMIVGYADIDASVLAQFPELKVIATCSAGTDMIDAATTSERDITLMNLPGVATEEVATHALALILAMERGLEPLSHLVRDGGWTDDATWLPRRLSSLTLGLVGFGRIGQHLATLAAPIFGDVIAYDPFITESPTVRLVELDELQRQSDVLSLHLPLTETTRGIVSGEFLGGLRTDAVLINVSRGELVDDAAIHAALAEHRLRGYAADVLHGDPPAAHDPMRTMPHALITPHVAFLSEQSQRLYEEQPARNIVSALKSASHSEPEN